MIRSENFDVGGLIALGALGYFEFDRLAFLQSAVPIAPDSTEVNEHIRSPLASNEAVALLITEPLDGTGSHNRPPFLELALVLRAGTAPSLLGAYGSNFDSVVEE